MKHVLLLALLTVCAHLPAQRTREAPKKFPIDAARVYQNYCAACHGEHLEGAQSTALKKKDWIYGRQRSHLFRTIMYGIPNTDMIPSFHPRLSVRLGFIGVICFPVGKTRRLSGPWSWRKSNGCVSARPGSCP